MQVSPWLARIVSGWILGTENSRQSLPLWLPVPRSLSRLQKLRLGEGGLVGQVFSFIDHFAFPVPRKESISEKEALSARSSLSSIAFHFWFGVCGAKCVQM